MSIVCCPKCEREVDTDYWPEECQMCDANLWIFTEEEEDETENIHL